MPKVYVLEDEQTSYRVLFEKPSNFGTDEIELTDEEFRLVESAEESWNNAQDLLRTKLKEASMASAILQVNPIIQGFIKQVASKTGIPYQLGSSSGGLVKLHEYCTFDIIGLASRMFNVVISEANDGLQLFIGVTHVNHELIYYWHASKPLTEPYRFATEIGQALLDVTSDKLRTVLLQEVTDARS
jgi:hypothetical protein